MRKERRTKHHSRQPHNPSATLVAFYSRPLRPVKTFSHRRKCRKKGWSILRASRNSRDTREHREKMENFLTPVTCRRFAAINIQVHICHVGCLQNFRVSSTEMFKYCAFKYCGSYKLGDLSNCKNFTTIPIIFPLIHTLIPYAFIFRKFSPTSSAHAHRCVDFDASRRKNKIFLLKAPSSKEKIDFENLSRAYLNLVNFALDVFYVQKISGECGAKFFFFPRKQTLNTFR